MVSAQLEELFRILTAHIIVSFLATQSFLDFLRIPVPPSTAILNRLVGVVDREEDSLGAYVAGQIFEGRGAEVATRGEVDVVLEVVVDIFLAKDISCLLRKRAFDILKPVVDAPEIVGDVLAEMTDDDLELREAVKDTVGHDAEKMQRYCVRKAKRWADEVLAILVECLVTVSNRRSWVDVDRNVKLLSDCPESVVSGIVVEKVRLTILTGVLNVVDQSAVEAQFGDSTAKFFAGLLWVMHRKGGKRAKFVAMFLDAAVHVIVEVTSFLLSESLVSDSLDARNGQGNDRVSDAVLVGDIYTFAGEGLDLAEVAVEIIGGNVKGSLLATNVSFLRKLKGFFEGDFSEHDAG